MAELNFDAVKARWQRLMNEIPTPDRAADYAVLRNVDAFAEYAHSLGTFKARLEHLEPQVGCDLERVMTDLTVYEQEWNQFKARFGMVDAA